MSLYLYIRRWIARFSFDEDWTTIFAGRMFSIYLFCVYTAVGLTCDWCESYCSSLCCLSVTVVLAVASEVFSVSLLQSSFPLLSLWSSRVVFRVLQHRALYFFSDLPIRGRLPVAGQPQEMICCALSARAWDQLVDFRCVFPPRVDV